MHERKPHMNILRRRLVCREWKVARERCRSTTWDRAVRYRKILGWTL